MSALPQQDRVQAALEELLSWPPIARSPQLARFLSYIVTTTLKGEEAQIKAYSIAVDVFGRPASFDPQSDPIVRVQARRLRALLDQFYDEGHRETGVRIHLPVGRYVPEFVSEDGIVVDRPVPETGVPTPPAADSTPVAGSAVASSPAAESARQPTWLVQALIAGFLVLSTGTALIAYVMQGPAPRPAALSEPSVLIGAFSNLTGMSELDGLGPRLATAVRDNLVPFEDLRVSLAEPGTGERGLPAGTYIVTGVVHPAPQGIEVAVTLTNEKGDALWNSTYAQPSPTGREEEVITALSKAVARELGPFRGPLHARGRAWLDEQGRPLPAVSPYACLLTYHLARETGSSTNIADALACNERLRKEQPEQAVALSTWAWLETRATLNRVLPASLDNELGSPLARAERAAQLAPDSSIVHEHLGTIKSWLKRFDASEQDFVTALRINPLNTDARAGYAIMLARDMEWLLGGEQAALAIADTPYPSPWYFYPQALNAFREGNYSMALEASRKAIRFSGGEVGTIIGIAAAQQLGRSDVTKELVPHLMAMESLRRNGVMPWLTSQIGDPAVLGRIAVELDRAGVPAAALTGSF